MTTLRRTLVLGVAVALLMTACGAGAGPLAPRHTIAGQFTLVDRTAASLMGSRAIAGLHHDCYGERGYEDVQRGLGVTLKDGDGKIIGLSNLSVGVGDDARTGATCVFTYSITDIPEVPFYSLQVGKRGEFRYSLADMKSRNWTINVRLGD